MRSRVTMTALALLLVLTAGPVAAEPLSPYVYISPFGGYTFFDRDMKNPNGKRLKDNFHGGLTAGVQLRRWLGFEATGSFTPTREDAPGAKDVDWMRAAGDFTLTPWSGQRGGVFALLGAGAGRLTTSGGGRRDNQMNAEIGAGVQLWFGDRLGARIEGRDAMWLPRDDKTSPKSHTLMASAGLTFALGGTTRDSDGDGIADRHDQCPNTPVGAAVDVRGCPSDGDGDGVPDGIDRCPATPKGATIDATGCSVDSDGDGVADGIDQCADTPRGATVDARGCTSDSDGDGVVDGIDRCQATPQGATVDSSGCPKDSDNDKVPDGIDQCPDTSPGLRVDATGCPIEVTDKETELLDTGMIRLQDVNFETGKATLMPESLPQLDIVGQVLTKWPDLRIEIGGHTDSRGSNAYNQQLSEARVTAVLNYLIEKYPTLKREQFTVKGYGESKPLVPNNSALNMAKNRRVEFKVLNTEVLKREVERRKLLRND